MSKGPALASKVLGLPLRTTQYVGLPAELNECVQPMAMPAAKALVIEPEDGGFLLIRYSRDREFAGDTWHETIDEAKEQAVFEFGNAISAWIEIPSDVQDLVAFAFDAPL